MVNWVITIPAITGVLILVLSIADIYFSHIKRTGANLEFQDVVPGQGNVRIDRIDGKEVIIFTSEIIAHNIGDRNAIMDFVDVESMKVYETTTTDNILYTDQFLGKLFPVSVDDHHLSNSNFIDPDTNEVKAKTKVQKGEAKTILIESRRFLSDEFLIELSEGHKFKIVYNIGYSDHNNTYQDKATGNEILLKVDIDRLQDSKIDSN
ncbi:hypothetical protein [Salinarchaeum sp. Harcht-Bsk1]|uniref:hypothetical protein n=1 Tax=Salinarchaeum sp. Harcht-Bsk1 TaxID=1333523 RepID=UPI0011817833|nr:hypothetical protein [Salinarchaeum sp. Harcht-Bsk1]